MALVLEPSALLVLFGTLSTNTSLVSLVDVFVPCYTLFVVAFLYHLYKEDSPSSLLSSSSSSIASSLSSRPPVLSSSSSSSSSVSGVSVAPPVLAKALSTGSVPSPPSSSSSAVVSGGAPSPCFTGKYKLEKNVNYQEFLSVQGVGWALRKAADSASLTHDIVHDVQASVFHIKVIGLVSGEMRYVVNGPAVSTAIKDKNFVDTVTYLPAGGAGAGAGGAASAVYASGGVRISKKNEKEGYTIVVERRLTLDGETLNMKQTVVFADGRAGAEATQVFKRIHD